MRLDGPESQNVEDRRGQGGGFGGGTGGRGFRIPIPTGGGGGIRVGGGLGGIAILLIALFLGVDLTGLVGGDDPSVQPAPQERRIDPGQTANPGDARNPSQDAGRRFVGQVLGETEQVWRDQFARAGRTYQEPTLVLFSNYTRSGCGDAEAQTGPFYCPLDQKVYIDLDFMAQLQRRLGAQGDFAAAYIIAHEVGHHVQNQLGVLQRAREAQQRYGGGVEANQIQVRVELQADCLAGVWAYHANRERNILEEGDLEEGLNAAAAVGDDRLQRQARGTVQPESFTHGSSAQRVRWFRRGFQNGNISACDTFGAQQL
ncbi:zinc metallopeptidase [Roseomonas sp. OT10]|uniref:KPN_02809 family neutral zinc metallopeptidase n=1 Tax=Roseomonas cutis TaxID=2897332 RepID=UPI001E386CE2|nr:neutral zinc metallopeptidase [Roseomonas sp. OT10]UFN49351.1 zinc metallopeptidase [Roseomonas sp. OT10]